MPYKMIRYRTRPESIAENRQLIEAVFEELKAKSPPGVRYMVVALPDGRFFHFVEAETAESPIPKLDAHRAFQAGIAERCAEPPQTSEAVVIGNYRMLESR
jgi:hypothetical protein